MADQGSFSTAPTALGGVANKKPSYYQKFKRYVVAKLSQTSSGQSIINRSLGPEGQMVLNITFRLMTEVSGAEQARHIKRLFYNIAGKIAVEAPHINLEDFRDIFPPIQESNYQFASYLANQLASDIEKRNVGGTLVLLEEATAKLLGFMPLFFSEKNVGKAVEVIEYFKTGGFFEYLMKNAANEKDCKILCKAIFKAMDPNADSNQNMPTIIRLMRKTLKCRKRDLESLLSTPHLIFYLRREESQTLIWDWLLKLNDKEAINKLNFHIAVEEFKSLTNRSLLQGRAIAIYEKFVSDTAAHRVVLSEDTKRQVAEGLNLTAVNPDEAAIEAAASESTAGVAVGGENVDESTGPEEGGELRATATAANTLFSSVNRNVFALAQREVVLSLSDLFDRLFVGSSFHNDLRDELEQINQRLEILFTGVEEDVLSDHDEDEGDSRAGGMAQAEKNNTPDRFQMSRLSFWRS